MAETEADTRRLITKPQNLNDAYGPPSNFLEIDVSNPQTVGVGRGRFTTYDIRVKVRRRPLSPDPRFADARPYPAGRGLPGVSGRLGQLVCRRSGSQGLPVRGDSPPALWKVLEDEGVG
ncbi:Sorting nexin-3 [Cricetulus griseus]|uniref:Sorting nexin-3 n=1 Tax=Cricetulus griseus TaxID=10029 RepID=G3GXK5_CRIGR|nr:Sorting nexin-3 [Cricetulus griseus]